MEKDNNITFPESNVSWGKIDHAILSWDKDKNIFQKFLDKILNIFGVETNDKDSICLDFVDLQKQ